MLIIPQEEIPSLLPMDECMAVMADALATLARGQAILPLRTMFRLPNDTGVFAMMPGYLGAPEALGIKVITVFPRNHGTAYDSHQGVVLLFETEHGGPIAMLDASSITAIRTAAVSGVATGLLARDGAHDLAILGSGVQARTHLDAMLHARRIERVRVWSRNPENARRFAREVGEQRQLAVEVMGEVQATVDGADIICTVTSSREPVLRGEWIAPGAHVNAVGASLATARELDSAAVVRASLFVDRRESTINEAGDFLVPKKEGLLGDDHIRAEIGEVLLGTHPGRTSDTEVTLFKSLGLAIEDVAAATQAYTRAKALGRGVEVALGGRRDA
jgi:ornithine cyclodeaminase/alanine dehydrogenase-like protein (mu-crystallin family)